MPTPFMELDLPTVSNTLGPEWASLLNAALEIIDSHDHSSGKGTRVTPAGISVNALFNMNNQNLTTANSYGLRNRTSADTSNLGSLQRLNGDLYWISPSGVSVQLTDGNNTINKGITTKVPGSYPYSILSSDNNKMLLVNTTAAARTLTLPNAADGAITVYIKDSAGNAQTNNITLNGNGSDLIDGVSSASGKLFNTNDIAFGVVSDGASNWYLF